MMQQLIHRHNVLAQLITRDKYDLQKVKAYCLESIEISERILSLAKSTSIMNHWRLELIQNLLVRSIMASDAKEFSIADTCFEEVVKHFKMLIRPIAPETNALFQHVEELYATCFKKHDENKKVIEDPEVASFNLSSIWTTRNNIYGNRGQAHYNQFAFDCVLRAVDLLQQHAHSPHGETTAFETILFFLAEARHRLAISTQSVEAENFGLIRVPLKPDSRENTFKIQTYGAQALRQNQTVLSHCYEPCLQDIKARHADFLMQYRVNGKKVFCEDYPHFSLHTTIYDIDDQIRIQRGEVTQDDQINIQYMMHLRDDIKSKDEKSVVNGFVISDVCLKLDDQAVSISSHLTGFNCERVSQRKPKYQSLTEHDIEQYREHGQGMMFQRGDIRTNAFFMDDLSKLFQRAIATDISKAELLKTTAEIHFKLAHNMFFLRGSAAISEWLIKTIYKYHGYKLKRFEPGVMVDLKALGTTDMDQFIEEYPSYWQENPTL